MTSLRTKVTLLVAAPLAVLLVLALMGVRSSGREQAEASQALQDLRVALAADDTALALVQERRLSVSDPDSEGLEAQRAQTDEAVEALASQLDEHGGVDPESGPSETVNPNLVSATDALAELESVRGTVTDGSDSSQVLAGFSEIVEPIVALDQVFRHPGDPDDQRFEAHRAVVRAIDRVARQESLVQLALAAGTLDPTSHRELTDASAEEAVWLGLFEESASSVQLDAYGQIRSAPSVTTADRLRDQVLTAGPDVPVEVDATMWPTAMDKKLELLITVAAEGAGELEHDLTALSGSARQAEQQAYLLVLGALGLGALANLVLHRVVVQPVRRLADDTQQAAAEIEPAVELGDVEGLVPVSRPRDDELADIADAFNTAQEAVGSLASDQGTAQDTAREVFANFGRRAQNLITRQLGQIDDLEARTDDPDMLADLFTLDHLSTRLRRNAESLAVLAGADSPRPWARPVSIVNVVRAAAAEAADYSRVDVANMPPAAVTGATANEVSHLLAELFDNALTYSPPESRVGVVGDRRADGAYLVAVTDAGLGMSPGQLSEANAHLRGALDRSADIPLSKYFGFYVVGRLARRHRIAVRLVPSHLNGIRAEVVLPRAIMVLPTDPQVPELLSEPAAGPHLRPGPEPMTVGPDATGTYSVAAAARSVRRRTVHPVTSEEPIALRAAGEWHDDH